MRSRLALVLLPVAVLIFFFLPRMPSEVPLHLHLGARGAELREVDVKFERDEAILRDLRLDFPSGAPTDVDRTVRLAPGDYQIALRLVDRQGHEVRGTQPCHVTSGEPISVDVAFLR